MKSMDFPPKIDNTGKENKIITKKESVSKTGELEIPTAVADKGSEIDDYKLDDVNNKQEKAETERITFEEQEKKYQEKFLNHLFKEGIVEQKKDVLVCDLEKIKLLSGERVKLSCGAQQIGNSRATNRFRKVNFASLIKILPWQKILFPGAQKITFKLSLYAFGNGPDEK